MHVSMAAALMWPGNSQGALDNLAGDRFANHDGLFPLQLADLGSASMPMPPMPWGR